MGAVITGMKSYYAYSADETLDEFAEQVFYLCGQSLQPLIQEYRPHSLSHLIVATTCPDSITPSLGQRINQQHTALFGSCHVLDIVQGCAGGASALILGSQLATLYKSNLLVVQADAARKATSRTSDIHTGFGNGSFACLIRYEDTERGLLHYKSQQYPELTDVVTVKLGHDAHTIIRNEGFPVEDPRKQLGLHLNAGLAIRLLKKAEGFYQAFVEESCKPDMLILHQVNPAMIRHLKEEVFSKYGLDVVDVSAQTGNCGAASIGIALDQVKNKISNRKVMICSFGTGGVITAGMWQF